MRRVLVVLFVAVAALGPAAVAPAQVGSEPILLILDASGSMNRVDDAGTVLIDAAKDALQEIVVRLPQDAEVGLRVYGHRTSNEDPIAGCLDTELVVPVGPIDRGALRAAIEAIDASGFTPIGLSLTEAMSDLESVGGGTVILVSDGVDTCAPPDPCEIAAEMAAAGILTRIHTVGFFLNDRAAEEQLQCIADAGHGSFTNVESVGGLFTELSELVLEGSPGRINSRIQGALTRDLAPLLEWRDMGGDPNWLANDTAAEGEIRAGEARWYAFDVDYDRVWNAHLYVTAVLPWQAAADPEEYLEVRIFNEEGLEVGVPHEVQDVVVEVPQRLYLADAGQYATPEPGWMPAATAVTGPRNAFPAWEGSEPFWEPTRDRFHAAGLNGGIYELWKWLEDDPRLPEGRYYASISWSSEREASANLQVFAVLYPGRRDEDLWVRDEPQGLVLNLEGRDPGNPTDLEMIDWTGPVLEGQSETPLRSIGVLSTIEGGEPVYLRFDLAADERVFVGQISGCLFGGDCGRLRELVLAHEDGTRAEILEPRNPPDYEEFAAGYPEIGEAFRTPLDGDYTLELDLREDKASEGDNAVFLGIFVYPPDGPMDPPEGGWADLPRSAWLSFMTGLASVRDAVASGTVG
jgi:hypothetical protein